VFGVGVQLVHKAARHARGDGNRHTLVRRRQLPASAGALPAMLFFLRHGMLLKNNVEIKATNTID